jgi:hypothetical protein
MYLWNFIAECLIIKLQGRLLTKTKEIKLIKKDLNVVDVLTV